MDYREVYGELYPERRLPEGKESYFGEFLDPDIKDDIDTSITAAEFFGVNGVDFKALIESIDTGMYEQKAEEIKNVVDANFEQFKYLADGNIDLLEELGASKGNMKFYYKMLDQTRTLRNNVERSFKPAMDAIAELKRCADELKKKEEECKRLNEEAEALLNYHYGIKDWDSQADAKRKKRIKIYYTEIIPLKRKIKSLLKKIEKYEQSIIDLEIAVANTSSFSLEY